MDTLNELRHLQESGFGRPWPRHGLHLLHWFSHNYVTLNNDEMVIERSPKKRAFGVHRFYDNDNLLPDEKLPFYEVGNLGKEHAEDLPYYVTEYHTVHDDSNIDRIIFSLKPGRVLHKIYVTQHDHHSGSFDPKHTYRITSLLVSIIGNLDLDDLLERAGYLLPCPPIKTLNEMRHLQESGFGRPRPRHGLHLLHWFSDEYVTLYDDDEMVIKRNPKKRAFGVHRFYDNDNLLPNEGFLFYEVGNLGKEHAEDLPDDVREYHKGHDDDSNVDRIIFSLKLGKVLDKIYVTQHDHHRDTFNPQHTYRISKGLVKIIGNLELEDFLEQAEYS